MNFIKAVAEAITSAIVNIINSSMDKEIFPDSWKVTRVWPVPKIDDPLNEKDSRPIQYYQHYQKFMKKSFLNNYLTIYRKNISL